MSIFELTNNYYSKLQQERERKAKEVDIRFKEISYTHSLLLNSFLDSNNIFIERNNIKTFLLVFNLSNVLELVIEGVWIYTIHNTYHYIYKDGTRYDAPKDFVISFPFRFYYRNDKVTQEQTDKNIETSHLDIRKDQSFLRGYKIPDFHLELLKGKREHTNAFTFYYLARNGYPLFKADILASYGFDSSYIDLLNIFINLVSDLTIYNLPYNISKLKPRIIKDIDTLIEVLATNLTSYTLFKIQYAYTFDIKYNGKMKQHIIKYSPLDPISDKGIINTFLEAEKEDRVCILSPYSFYKYKEARVILRDIQRLLHTYKKDIEGYRVGQASPKYVDIIFGRYAKLKAPENYLNTAEERCWSSIKNRGVITKEDGFILKMIANRLLIRNKGYTSQQLINIIGKQYEKEFGENARLRERDNYPLSPSY